MPYEIPRYDPRQPTYTLDCNFIVDRIQAHILYHILYDAQKSQIDEHFTIRGQPTSD
jgi:hypothetical protein